MKVIKTEIRFKTSFQQPKTGFPKNPVLTSLVTGSGYFGVNICRIWYQISPLACILMDMASTRQSSLGQSRYVIILSVLDPVVVESSGRGYLDRRSVC